jgi:hypothetical protein
VIHRDRECRGADAEDELDIIQVRAEERGGHEGTRIAYQSGSRIVEEEQESVVVADDQVALAVGRRVIEAPTHDARRNHSLRLWVELGDSATPDQDQVARVGVERHALGSGQVAEQTLCRERGQIDRAEIAAGGVVRVAGRVERELRHQRVTARQRVGDDAAERRQRHFQQRPLFLAGPDLRAARVER